jgi:hypothetical protein
MDPLVLSSILFPLINAETASTNMECYCELPGTWRIFLNLYAFQYRMWCLRCAADEHIDHVFLAKE